jgi:glyoxylase-like metal-dependent hydrolase (beta-lactamase superfamily II)
MLHAHHIGNARIMGITEYFGPTHDPRTTFPDFDERQFAAVRDRLPPGFYFANVDRLVIAINIWVVHAGGAVILIDAGVGNAKRRPAARMNLLNTLVPQWLAAAGAAPEQVTHVVLTHLHSDHVGWCTTLHDDRWVPTFPKARYFFPRGDFAYFKERSDSGAARETSFNDSVMPVVDAGLSEFVDPGDGIAGCLVAEAAYGHTPGHLAYRLRGGQSSALFCGDVFHSPLQILMPGWNTAFCIEAETARSTRNAVLAEAEANRTLLLPCHFAPPHCGYVRREARGYGFEPAS